MVCRKERRPDTNMDIVRIAKFIHIKANFSSLGWKHKIFLLIFLFSLTTTLMPHETYAAFLVTPDYHPVLVFDTGGNTYQDYLIQISQDATDRYYKQQLQQQVQKEQKLILEVQAYLEDQHSPLAEYTSTLITLRNWKQIVALANAESSLCRNYPVSLSNCWGVGGSSLWDMGDNLGQAVVKMNHFLNQNPRGPVKYSEMGFDQMNGLYKKPAAEHWYNNAQTVYDDLANIENNL
ncbi:MAG TPA: hypothetical protein VL306_00120 [Methylomirabilota bacterium]|nr:hypothetical protein [Methylomirabilota bacterium]